MSDASDNLDRIVLRMPPFQMKYFYRSFANCGILWNGSKIPKRKKQKRE